MLDKTIRSNAQVTPGGDDSKLKRLMALSITILLAVMLTGCFTVKIDPPPPTPTPSTVPTAPETSPPASAAAEPFTGILKIKSGDSYDMDGDGNKEKIELKTKSGSLEYTLKIGDDDITDTSSDFLTGDIYLANLVNGDGKPEVFVFTPGPSSDPETYWYSYEDKVVRELGDIPMDPASMKVEGDGTVKGRKVQQFVETSIYDAVYKLNAEGSLEEQAPDYIPLDTEATLLTDLLARKDPQDALPADIAFKNGDKVKLGRTDMKQWLELIGASNPDMKGWVRVTDNGASIEGTEGKPLYDIFEGLNLAD